MTVPVLFAEIDPTTIAVAIGVALITATGPTLLAVTNGRQAKDARKDAADARREDWARQDEVARVAKEEAEAQRVSQALIAEQNALAAVALEQRQDATEAEARDVAAQAREAASLLTRRQDTTESRAEQVATQAAEAAELLRVTNQQITEESERAHQDNARLESKIDQVHVLVNSKLTDSLRAQAVMLAQMVDLMTADIVRLGTDADPGAVARRDVAQTELERLRRVLADREIQTDLAADVAAAELQKNSPAEGDPPDG